MLYRAVIMVVREGSLQFGSLGANWVSLGQSHDHEVTEGPCFQADAESGGGLQLSYSLWMSCLGWTAWGLSACARELNWAGGMPVRWHHFLPGRLSCWGCFTQPVYSLTILLTVRACSRELSFTFWVWMWTVFHQKKDRQCDRNQTRLGDLLEQRPSVMETIKQRDCVKLCV